MNAPADICTLVFTNEQVDIFRIGLIARRDHASNMIIQMRTKSQMTEGVSRDNCLESITFWQQDLDLFNEQLLMISNHFDSINYTGGQ